MKITPLTLGVGAVGVGGVAAAGYGVSTLVSEGKEEGIDGTIKHVADTGDAGAQSQDGNNDQALQPPLSPVASSGTKTSRRRARPTPLDNNGCTNAPFEDWSAPTSPEGVYVGKTQKSSFIFAASTQKDTLELRGCSSVSYSSTSSGFSLRSETRIKRANIGMLFLTNIDSTENGQMHLTHYLFFLEKINGQNPWVTRGGYGWGGERKPIQASKLKIQLPKNREAIILPDATKSTSQSVGTKWTKNDDGQEPLEIGGDWYRDSDKDGDTFTFNPHTLKGFKETWLFATSDAGGKNWSWKEYCTEDEVECKKEGRTKRDHIDVTKSVTDWYNLFKEKGNWK